MVEECKWNSDSGTVRWNSKIVFVELWKIVGGTVWWNSVGGTGEQRNNTSGTVEQ